MHNIPYLREKCLRMQAQHSHILAGLTLLDVGGVPRLKSLSATPNVIIRLRNRWYYHHCAQQPCPCLLHKLIIDSCICHQISPYNHLGRLLVSTQPKAKSRPIGVLTSWIHCKAFYAFAAKFLCKSNSEQDIRRLSSSIGFPWVVVLTFL